MRWLRTTRRDYTARRLWLGSVPGTDWLHEAIELEFGDAKRRREDLELTWADPEPDFERWQFCDVPKRVKEELADVMTVPAAQLERLRWKTVEIP